MESRYTYNPENFTLERYSQQPSDYEQGTYNTKEACLEGLTNCNLSYSDGQAWTNSWDANKGQIPRAVKINFKFQGEDKLREFIVNIPTNP